MAARRENTCDRVLVVEGFDDLLFYAEVLEKLGNYDDKVFIKEMGGKGNLTGAARPDDLVLKLETFLSPRLLAEKRVIGVIADADENGAGTARSLEQRLAKITAQDVKAGAWTAGPPRIGLFVVPGGDRAGEIASLVWEAWSNDPVNAATRACVDGFLGCMKAAGHEAHSPDKGRLGALLAVRNDEDPRLGPGARAHVFDFERPELAPLVAFLHAF
ncbi:MAG TPA: DUF3226 domain-containing protein [Polyangiaceae bacterium]|nr:DUF3226 domain-containing protein [Polyangiaceae bacterium]